MSVRTPLVTTAAALASVVCLTACQPFAAATAGQLHQQAQDGLGLPGVPDIERDPGKDPTGRSRWPLDILGLWAGEHGESNSQYLWIKIFKRRLEWDARRFVRQACR